MDQEMSEAEASGAWIYTGSVPRETWVAAPETPGQVAAEAWTASHQAHHRCLMTGWAELAPEHRADWEAAAEAVLRAFRSDD
jgi:hypothetical protein